MLSQLLRVFGLARAGQVRALAAEAESARARAREMKTELDGTREDIRRWRTQIDELKERLLNASRDVERWKGKDAEHVEELNALKAKFERLKAAEQTTAIAREHLLAIETKLDIVEGAIDVLDRRTRAAVATSSESPTGGGGRS